MNLKQWMKNNRHSSYSFAKLLLEKAEVKVSPQAVQHWCNGTVPRKPYRVAVEKVTDGKVTPASFL